MGAKLHIYYQFIDDFRSLSGVCNKNENKSNFLTCSCGKFLKISYFCTV
jgi:hypothetical protein